MAKILIVEDDPMISEIYHKKFTESNFEVFLADSGIQALEIARKEKIDVMLLDLIMPQMDGFEVIKNIREEGNTETKIFIFSNLSQKEDREKATKLGANGFIVKSEYTPNNLVKEVSRLLNQNNEEAKNEKIRNNNGGETGTEKNESLAKKRVLLIEDEEIFLEMFGNKLRQDGFEVETASNGAWGLKEALKKKFDLFIIDMVMPAMTGDEIIEKLKMEERTKNIPIIVLSASVENHVEEKVKKMGINEFFVKTQIIPSDLSKKVEELIKENN